MYRARHRLICRGHQSSASPSTQVEDLDIEDGRARKISTKWRRQQLQQLPVTNQLSNSVETLVGFNAFDFSASPEAFHETQQLNSRKLVSPSNKSNQEDQHTNNNHSSLWERRVSVSQQSKIPARHVPTLGKDALWGGQVHYSTQDAQRQALYHRPQYYA